MKLKKILPVIVLAIILIFYLMPGQDGTPAATVSDVAEAAENAVEQLQILSPDETDAEAPEEPSEEPVTESGERQLDPDGSYTAKEDVALYIHTYGCLPDNFVTKKEAQKAGWSGGSLEKYLPGKCIGGNYFGNNEGLLPDAPGRKWTECDINTLGAKSRGAERIVFSNDGLIYYTNDHYESFELLYDGWK